MRLNKILLAAVLSVSAVMLPSCLKDQEDLFDQSANERVQATMDYTKAILEEPKKGWLFEYTPDRKLRFGTWIYMVQFENGKVSVRSELDQDKCETSMYKLTQDNGPVLSFDTYNSLMHHFATPSGSSSPAGGYQAHDGDFEFVIMDVKPDVITLRGSRTGNIMYMYRQDDSADPVKYIKESCEIVDNLIFADLEEIRGNDTISASISTDKRYIEMGWNGKDGERTGAYYVPTPTGLKLLSPLVFDGSVIEKFDFDNKKTLSAVDSNGGQVNLEGLLPDDYSFYDDYLGDFTIYFGKKSENKMDISIQKGDGAREYIVKGMSSQFDMKATFNKPKGCIEMCVQQVGSEDGYDYWALGWALSPDTGTGSWSSKPNCGLYFVKDIENPGTYNLVANGQDITITSLLLKKFPAGTLSGAANPSSPWLFSNKSHQFSWIQKIVKK